MIEKVTNGGPEFYAIPPVVISKTINDNFCFINKLYMNHLKQLIKRGEVNTDLFNGNG